MTASHILHSTLRSAAARWRRSQALRRFFGCAAVAAVVFFMALLADAWFHFRPVWRWLALAATVAPLCAGAAWAFLTWRKKISEESIARRIEATHPEVGETNALINAVQFDKELAGQPHLRQAVLQEIKDPFPGIDWGRVFCRKHLLRAGLALGAGAALIAGWGIVSPQHFANSAARIFAPAAQIDPLTRTKFASLTPGQDQRLVHGSALKVAATLRGIVPAAAWLHFKEQGADWQKVPMPHGAGDAETAFEFSWPKVLQPMTYFIEAGDARSAEFEVSLRPRTVLRKCEAEIAAPEYTKLPANRLQDVKGLNGVLAGSSVKVTAVFSAPLKELRAKDERGAALTTTQVAPETWSVETGQIKGNKTLVLEFTDEEAFADQASFPVATVPDDPPVIAITAPEEGKVLVADHQGTLALAFRASDRYGLATLAVYRGTDAAQDAMLVEAFDAKLAGATEFTGVLQAPLAKFVKEDEDRATFYVIATDNNTTSGPGRTVSRPVVVSLVKSEDLARTEAKAKEEFQSGLRRLIEAQSLNLKQTGDARRANASSPAEADFGQKVVSPLMGREAEITQTAVRLAVGGEAVAPAVARDLRQLAQNEMQAAILAFRDAVSSADQPGRERFLGVAAALQTQILARLQGAPERVSSEGTDAAIRDLLAGVGDLLKKQRAILADTEKSGAEALASLSKSQEQLADQSQRVQQDLDRQSKDAGGGDADFRNRVAEAARMMLDLKIYEDMLASAEALDAKNKGDAVAMQKQTAANLAKIVSLLNQWQIARAKEEADDLKNDTKDLAEKLEKLAEIQREIVEKSKEMARKADFRPEDVASADAIAEQKALMGDALEKMLTDMHALPDLNVSNELKSELVSVYEDVIQADKDAVANDEKKPTEIAVQKEESLLQALDEAQKRAEELEHWLPNTAEAEKWLLENFDKTEMPEIPNVPLQEQMEDLVGDLLEEQETMDADVQDAASNQAMQQNVNGWDVRDGPMPGFGNNGKSGNERPNDNEMTGRSSGGREGKSNGEMVGGDAKDLEGRQTEVRRTNDPMQQGKVSDEGQMHHAKATGGGKAGGYSDGQALDGDAPRRQVNAPRRESNDASAAAQAILAEKAARAATEAKLLYLPAQPMAEVARLMDESAAALKEGRLSEYGALHRKIVGKLKSLQSGTDGGEALELPNADAQRTQDRQLLGGYEGDAPEEYKDRVADYYRSLVDDAK
jgi:hypothetical protein